MNEQIINLCSNREMKPVFKLLSDAMKSAADGKPFAILSGGITWFVSNSGEISATDKMKGV